MATPVIESIALKLAEYINAITVANGFHQDLTVIRPKRIHLESNIYADGNVVLFQADCDLIEATDEEKTWLQWFQVQAIVIDSDSATTAIDTRLNQVRSDIEKKLSETASRFLGGIAQGIVFDTVTTFIQAPATVVDLKIGVRYKTDYDDPYTAVTE